MAGMPEMQEHFPARPWMAGMPKMQEQFSAERLAFAVISLPLTVTRLASGVSRLAAAAIALGF
jgi:hypothetical protein